MSKKEKIKYSCCGEPTASGGHQPHCPMFKKYMSKKEKKLKDQRFIEYTIKIDHIREVFKLGDTTRYKDKMFCVDIKDEIGGRIIFCETTLKKLLKEIFTNLCPTKKKQKK